MTIELTDRERDVLRFLVDDQREALGRQIKNKQEQLRLEHIDNREQIGQMMRAEQKIWNELRKLSEKLDK